VSALLIAAGVLVLLYLAGVLALAAVGRGGDAAALARFVPDCVVLIKRLIADRRVPVQSKVLLGLLIVYVVSPIDLIPDFIPVAGQLDDAVLLAAALRHLVHSSGTQVIAEHWPGPASTLNAVLLLSGARVR
jgi:uncharacterized membrane protein YkvA (DUF1232 family)